MHRGLEILDHDDFCCQLDIPMVDVVLEVLLGVRNDLAVLFVSKSIDLLKSVTMQATNTIVNIC